MKLYQAQCEPRRFVGGCVALSLRWALVVSHRDILSERILSCPPLSRKNVSSQKILLPSDLSLLQEQGETEIFGGTICGRQGGDIVDQGLDLVAKPNWRRLILLSLVVNRRVL